MSKEQLSMTFEDIFGENSGITFTEVTEEDKKAFQKAFREDDHSIREDEGKEFYE